MKSMMSMINTVLLQTTMVRDTVGDRETSETLVQGASSVLLLVTLAGWIVSYKLFSIEKQGKKYYLYNLVVAFLYLPFLVWHFLNCMKLNFRTGTEHYVLLFFAHTVILVLWSLGFYGRNKQEESL